MQIKCSAPRCKGAVREGLALLNREVVWADFPGDLTTVGGITDGCTISPFPNATVGEVARLSRCWKCSSCGASWTR